MTDPMLPEFSGTTKSSGCRNPDCESSGRYLRVMSEAEMERIYPALSDMSFAPIPPQATHVCEKCGFVFSGMSDEWLEVKEIEPGNSRPNVNIDAYDWDVDEVYAKTVIDAAVSLVEGAPEDADRETVAEAIEQYIPGLSRNDMSTVVGRSNRDFETPEMNIAEFM